MNYNYEIVKYNKNIPGRLLMQDKPGWRCNTTPHWHDEIEIVYMIDGEMNALIEGGWSIENNIIKTNPFKSFKLPIFINNNSHK